MGRVTELATRFAIPLLRTTLKKGPSTHVIRCCHGNVVYRPAEKKDLSTILEICTEDDSDHEFRIFSPAIMEFLYKITRDRPGSFLVAECNQKVIGSMVAYHLNQNLCHHGIGTIAEQYRGIGVGRELLKRLIALTEHMNVTGYTKEAPATAGLYPNTTIGLQVTEYFADLDHTAFCSEDEVVAVRTLEKGDRESLVEYDQSIAYRGSANIVDGYLGCAGIEAVVARKRGEVVGYGAIDTTHNRGCPIGPFYADDIEVAKCILSRMAEISKGRRINFSLPDCNTDFRDYLERLNCRVYRVPWVLLFKHVVPISTEKIYGLSPKTVYVV